MDKVTEATAELIKHVRAAMEVIEGQYAIDSDREVAADLLGIDLGEIRPAIQNPPAVTSEAVRLGCRQSHYSPFDWDNFCRPSSVVPIPEFVDFGQRKHGAGTPFDPDRAEADRLRHQELTNHNFRRDLELQVEGLETRAPLTASEQQEAQRLMHQDERNTLFRMELEDQGRRQPLRVPGRDLFAPRAESSHMFGDRASLREE